MTSLVVSARAVRTRAVERAVILGALLGITAVAWVYTVGQSRQMSSGMVGHAMGMTSMAMHQPWTATDFGLRFVMWMMMMVAMMVPTAVPMTLVYAAVARKAARERNPVPPTSVFVAGYVFMWCVFAVAATSAQLGLDHAAVLSSQMAVTSRWISGAVVVVAGVYELTPLKSACLAHCRAPAHFIAQHWRAGGLGTARLGMHLGAYCLGCCWVLMFLLFVGGVMNLVWIAAIAGFVLLEKTVPFAEIAGRLAGVALVVLGVAELTGRLVLN